MLRLTSDGRLPCG